MYIYLKDLISSILIRNQIYETCNDSFVTFATLKLVIKNAISDL